METCGIFPRVSQEDSGMKFSECCKIIQAHQGAIPVPLIDIAHQMGLRVFTVPDWDASAAGKIEPADGGGFCIYVNGGYDAGRQRFVIAHEIAHFVLHKDMIRDGVYDDRRFQSNLAPMFEAEANQLAALILLPEKWVKNLHSEMRGDIPALAERFGVTQEAMAYRLRQLGL